MPELTMLEPTFGLQATSEEMSPEQRCSIGIQNIELLCDLDWRGRLMLGAELSRMKYSGDFTRDSVWNADDTARSWEKWLKRRGFTLEGGDTAISATTAKSLMMWSVLFANFVAENEKRALAGLLPLPLPTSVSQLRPYASMMQRVDDWTPPQLDRSHPSNHEGSFEMEPPYAAEQPKVIAEWQEAFESIPPDERTRKGELRPPTEKESKKYLKEKEGLRKLKEREQKQAKEAALNVGNTAADPKQQAAAASAPRTKKKAAAPKKSAAQIEAECRAYQLQNDVRSYRIKLNNLQQSAESLEAFIKNTLSREGSEAYLQEMRQQPMGVYSVDDDVTKLRDAVVVCQSVFKLITEKYQPPAPISRHEVDPKNATVEA